MGLANHSRAGGKWRHIPVYRRTTLIGMRGKDGVENRISFDFAISAQQTWKMLPNRALSVESEVYKHILESECQYVR